MLITDENALKTIRTYLPYVCIVCLSWVNYQQFKINEANYNLRIKDKIEEENFWKDAYQRTAEAKYNITISDSRLHGDSTHSSKPDKLSTD